MDTNFDTNGQTQTTIETIASCLLNEKLILTALELHMELLETGQEISVLRDYFSNPVNFEQSKIETSFQSKLIRTSSIQTFDSLDFARYSDDGEKSDNDKVAVLEFELRKAHEKINVLRSSLTKSVENSDMTLKLNSYDVNVELELYEKRTINFLINEYLLQNNYKLTSVTFSEENDNQDFDDWDDVGINISKPPNLIHLYHDYKQNKLKVEKHDFQCMTSFQQEESVLTTDDTERHIHVIQILKEKNMELEIASKALEKENCSLRNEIIKLRSIHSYPTTVDDDCKTNCVTYPSNEALSSQSVSFDKSQFNTVKEISKFQMNLIKLIDQRKQLFNYIIDIKSIQLIEVIDLLAFNLPKIISNTLLAKRDELIPILVYTITLHSESNARDKLLYLLFNLIKKPNYEQRLMIINGCLIFSNYVGPVQTEAELLPFCWEQISHKHIEHRLLVAEICGYLSSYVINDTRSSLLFSMVKQMSEDNEEDVREAVVHSLAILISNFEDDNKYKQTIEMLAKFFNDKSERVLHATRSLLLPSVAKWSLELNYIENFIKTTILENVDNCVYAASANSSVVKDQKLFNDHILNLHQILPYLFCHLVQTCEQFLTKKNYNNSDKILRNDNSNNVDNFDYVDALSIILNKQQEDVAMMIDSFFNYVNQEWFEIWDTCEWIMNEFVSHLVELTSKLEISQPALHSMVIFFRQLSQMFGKNLSHVILVKKFEKYVVIPLDEVHLDKSLINSQSPLNKSIVPIYLAGVYPILREGQIENCRLKNGISDLSERLHDLLVTLSVHQSSLASLQSTFEELCSQAHLNSSIEIKHYHNILIKLLWEIGVLHTNFLVRISTAKLFECFIISCSISEIILSSKVIPALVTLASDVNESVKAATISAFGAIIEYVFTQVDANNSSSATILDKVKLQLQVFMAEQSFTPYKTNEFPPSEYAINNVDKNLIIIEVIKVLGRLGPKVESKFRDEFILPRLTALAVRSQLSLNIDPSIKHELTMRLLEAFINCSCCFVCHQVSQEVVLPGLRCLHHDIQSISPDRANIVMSMIKELEDKVEESDNCNQKVTSSEKILNTPSRAQSQIETTKNNFFNRFKDVKEKASHSSITKVFQNSKN